MLNSPFPGGDVIARLHDRVELLRAVGNAADLESAIESKPAAVPAAFVVISERGGVPKGASGGMQIQRVQVSIAVVLVVTNFSREQTGGGARKDMDALVGAVDAAIVNWSPGRGVFLPLWFTAGRDAGFKAGTLTHQRIYSSEYSNRTETNP